MSTRTLIGNVKGQDGLTINVKVNGETFTHSGDTVDIGTVLREHQSLSEYRKAADQDEIDGTFVQKVEGKQLSTEDFTTDEKTKLGTVEENAKDNIYWCTPHVTKSSDIQAALSAGQMVCLRISLGEHTNLNAMLARYDETANRYYFLSWLRFGIVDLITFDVANDTWQDDSTELQFAYRLKTSWSAATSNEYYLGAAFLKDEFNKKYSKPTGGIPKTDLASDVLEGYATESYVDEKIGDISSALEEL